MYVQCTNLNRYIIASILPTESLIQSNTWTVFPPQFKSHFETNFGLMMAVKFFDLNVTISFAIGNTPPFTSFTRRSFWFCCVLAKV